MIPIFVSHTKENADCAEQLRKDLEAHGYTTWREPASLTIESITYPRTIENVILGSAAVVLVWSSRAAQSEWVERHILFAQSLKKLIFPVVLDGTSLPNTLISVTPVTSQTPCTNTVTALMALPKFPTPQSTDPLIKLYDQAAHEFIRERKAAIDVAAEMLKRNEHREAVLALLEYMARNDMMMGVRDKAQEVLDADAKKASPPSFLRPGDSRHMFGVRCKNGHVTYFDKREVCGAHSLVPRDMAKSAGVELDELHLKCEHPDCGAEVVARVDCREYRVGK
jgi:TIR domain